MKQIAFLIMALALVASIACAPIKSTQTNAVTQNATVAAAPNTPMYTAGQVEWIARSFSPDCRVQKPFTGKSG